MKKVLALVLAAAMLLAGNVVALAADTSAKDSGAAVNPETVTLEVGRSFVLLADLTPADKTWELTWTSSDPAVAEVDEDGIVKGIKEGTATITLTAKIQGNSQAKSAQCTVNVVAKGADGTAVTGISLDLHNATVRNGGTTTLTATVTPADAANKTVIWTSSNKYIATVDQNGKVTGVMRGNATIRATSQDGNLWEECIVNVEAGNVDDYPISLPYGDGAQHRLYLPDTADVRPMGYSINETQRNGVAYASKFQPNSITFKKGLLAGTIGKGYFFIGPAAAPKASDVGKTLEDQMVVSLSDGKQYTFNISMKITDRVTLSFPTNRSIPMGQPATIKIDIRDAANIAKAPYTVTVTQGNENVLAVGQMSVEGKSISIPVTPLKLGSVSMSVKLKDANGKNWGGVSWTQNVVNKTPTTPTTPGSFDRDTGSKDEPSNEANQGSTLVAIAAANDALSTGKAMPGKVQNVTIASGASVPAVPVKLYGLNASMSVGTMELLAQGKVGMKINLDNGAAEVIIPGGFQMPTGTGVLGYSLGFQKDPLYTNLMKSAVKGDSAKTEVYKLGGGTLPTTATVTIKTKLTGKVNIYYWNEDTRKTTLIASPTAENGKVTFATRQLGNLILTTGTI